MNTTELLTILKSDPYSNKSYISVCPSDQLPSGIPSVPACFIINTDPSWKPGSHWLAVFIDGHRNVEFFDSYGRTPEKYKSVHSFLKRCSDSWKINNQQLQSALSSTCGQFCIYFLLWRCRGITFEKIIRSFDISVDTNDILVTAFVNSVSGRNTKVYDVEHVVNQCCSNFVPL